MSKRKKWIATAIVLVVFAAALAIYNHYGPGGAAQADLPVEKGPRKKSILNVNGLVIRPTSLTDGITTVGNLLPDEEVDLSFETSGKIVAINFREGTPVTRGELLAKVNDLPLVAQLSRYEAQLKLAEDRVYRQSALLEKDAVSLEAYEQARTELAMLNADIDIVRSNIALTELHAPFDGVIGLRNVSEGAYASPDVVVAKLTKISPLKIDFFVPGALRQPDKTRDAPHVHGRGVQRDVPRRGICHRVEDRPQYPLLLGACALPQYAGQAAARTLRKRKDPDARHPRRHRHPDRSPRAGDGRRQGIPLQGRQSPRRSHKNRAEDGIADTGRRGVGPGRHADRLRHAPAA